MKPSAGDQTVPRLRRVLRKNRALPGHPGPGLRTPAQDISGPHQAYFFSSLQAESRASTVFIDKPDSRALKGAPYNIKRGPTRFANSCLKLIDCRSTDPGFLGEFFLVPTKKPASRPALRRSDCCC